MVSTEPIVLIVDDEIPIRRFLRVSLTGEGYRVVEAGTAREALDQIAAQRPDVVVLDLGLPDRDGVPLIREIREWSSVPIVVLSVRDRERPVPTTTLRSPSAWASCWPGCGWRCVTPRS